MPSNIPIESDAVRSDWVMKNVFKLQRFVLFRAIRALSKDAPGSLDALALIRGSFQTKDGGWASLNDARVLLELIKMERE